MPPIQVKDVIVDRVLMTCRCRMSNFLQKLGSAAAGAFRTPCGCLTKSQETLTGPNQFVVDFIRDERSIVTTVMALCMYFTL